MKPALAADYQAISEMSLLALVLGLKCGGKVTVIICLQERKLYSNCSGKLLEMGENYSISL